MTVRFACLEQLPLYSAKATHTCLRRIRDSREANIWLRSQASHLAKIFSLQISSRTWSHVHGNLFKSHGFHRFFLNTNVISFYLHFLPKNAFSPFLLLKACFVKGWKIMSFQDFFLEVNFIGSKTLNALNALDFTEFRNHIDYRKFLRD